MTGERVQAVNTFPFMLDVGGEYAIRVMARSSHPGGFAGGPADSEAFPFRGTGRETRHADQNAIGDVARDLPSAASLASKLWLAARGPVPALTAMRDGLIGALLLVFPLCRGVLGAASRQLVSPHSLDPATER